MIKIIDTLKHQDLLTVIIQFICSFFIFNITYYHLLNLLQQSLFQIMSHSQEQFSKQQYSSAMNPQHGSTSLSNEKVQKNSTQKLSANQLYEQLKLKCNMMRVEVTLHLKHVENIWNITSEQLQDYFLDGKYKQLPYSQIRVQQLFEMERAKISRSENKCYFGQIKSKKKQGQGIAIYREGKVYEGSFHDNQKSGFGVQVYANENLYIGSYSQNKKHGKGSFFWFNLNDDIIGLPQNNPNNKKQPLVEQYHGDWWGGLPDGQGQHHKNNGDFYIGYFKNGLKHGNGIEMYANGDKYKGDFINGLSEGYGQYMWNEGSLYKGDFKQGSRNGYGIWKGGETMKQIYKGHYMIDRKHGYGVYDWGNGYVYKGFFVEDFRYGEGQLYLNGQLQYKGYWQNGEKVDEKPINYPTKQIQETNHTSMKDSGIRNNSQQKVSMSRYESRGKTAKTRNCSADRRNKSRQQYSVTFKKQENSQQKSRVGHRNCVPCQNIGKMPKRNWKP